MLADATAKLVEAAKVGQAFALIEIEGSAVLCSGVQLVRFTKTVRCQQPLLQHSPVSLL